MKKTKLPGLITILILTMATTVMWVGFSVYRAFTRVPEDKVPEEISATISPILDTDAIDIVESSVYFDESQIPPLTLNSQPTGTTPVSTFAPRESPTASPTETPSAPEVAPTASPAP